jgi:hypothetical protein
MRRDLLSARTLAIARRPAVADDIAPITPDEWDGTEWVPLHVLAHRHDHKGHSEEMCIRCGWVMGHIPLNCQNDDTPHVFPSQQSEIERLRNLGDDMAYWYENLGPSMTMRDAVEAWKEARRG